MLNHGKQNKGTLQIWMKIFDYDRHLTKASIAETLWVYNWRWTYNLNKNAYNIVPIVDNYTSNFSQEWPPIKEVKSIKNSMQTRTILWLLLRDLANQSLNNLVRKRKPLAQNYMLISVTLCVQNRGD